MTADFFQNPTLHIAATVIANLKYLHMSKYKISYEFKSTSSHNEIRESVLRYWVSRNFNCHFESNKLYGKRGSLMGNLTSFDMTKLICDLQVVFKENNCVYTELFVDGKLQDITEINLWDFKLELISFHRNINNLPKPDFLAEYLDFKKTSDYVWFFSLSLLGRKLTKDLKTKLEKLTDRERFPIAEIL